MRYYSITISDQKTGESLIPTGLGFARGTGTTFSSLAKRPFTGQLVPDPGALNVEFDIPVTQLAIPQGAFRIKIWGVGLKCLSQAANLSGMRFSMNAGMSHGLPLANSAQAGPVAQGNIFQGYGNWQGVNQTLDLIVNPGPPGATESIFDRSLSFFWPAGTSLYDAIDAALQATLPEFKRQIFIDPNLVLSHDEAGWYANPSQWASYLLGVTQPLGAQLVGANYPGVQIMVTGDTIYVFDEPQNKRGSVTIPLAFQDLIGQPTWISATAVQFNTVLRADIGVGNRILFPTGVLTPYALTAPGLPFPPTVPAASRSIFQGEFVVKHLHHFGNFRDADADSWVTAFEATVAPGLK